MKHNVPRTPASVPVHPVRLQFKALLTKELAGLKQRKMSGASCDSVANYGWFDPDPANPPKYYQQLLARRKQMLSLDCNTRGKMQQEWISLIVEMDAVMRVCHSHLGTVDFSRPRTRSFRGESFLDFAPQQHASAAAVARQALCKADPPPAQDRIAVGYLRLPLSGEASKSSRGQTLQRPIILRQFWRHPSWPDPDSTFIWAPKTEAFDWTAKRNLSHAVSSNSDSRALSSTTKATAKKKVKRRNATPHTIPGSHTAARALARAAQHSMPKPSTSSGELKPVSARARSITPGESESSCHSVGLARPLLPCAVDL